MSAASASAGPVSVPLDHETAAMLEDSLDRLVAAHPPARRQPGDGTWRTPDAALWRAMAELGVTGLGVAEDRGGTGGSLADLARVMGRAGRDLLLEPLFSSVVLAAPLLAEAAAAPPPELGQALSGQLVLALAHQEPGLGYARFPISTTVRIDQGSQHLTGVKGCVLGGPGSDRLVVTACRPDGTVGVYLADPQAPGVRVDAYRLVDGSPAADVTFVDAPCRGIGDVDPGDAVAAIHATLDRATVLVCAEAVGAMEAVLALCRDYLQTRRAFGRTLSAFQVLQHRFVDMHIALEEARALLEATLAGWDASAGQRAACVAACKVTVSRAGRFIGEQGLHLHGGIGMTDEFVVSHYYKRLMTLETCLGDAEHHAAAYAALCREDLGA